MKMGWENKVKLFPHYGLQLRDWQKSTTIDNWWQFLFLIKATHIQTERELTFSTSDQIYTRLLDWLWQSRFCEGNLLLCTSGGFPRLQNWVSKHRTSLAANFAGRKTSFHGSKNQGINDAKVKKSRNQWCKSQIFSSRVWCLFLFTNILSIVSRSRETLHFRVLSIGIQCIHVRKSCSCLPNGYWWLKKNICCIWWLKKE